MTKRAVYDVQLEIRANRDFFTKSGEIRGWLEVVFDNNVADALHVQVVNVKKRKAKDTIVEEGGDVLVININALAEALKMDVEELKQKLGI